MADWVGAPWKTPETTATRLHRDVRPQRRVEPGYGDDDTLWLDGVATTSSLQRLAYILDPLVLLANLGGYAAHEVVLVARPGLSDKVLSISLPECRFAEGVQPESTGATFWRDYIGIDFPPEANLAIGLRLQIERVFGTIAYEPGVAVDFTHPSVLAWPWPDDEAALFDALVLLSSPEALQLDDWLPALADTVADEGGLRAWLVDDLVDAARRVADATTPVLPAGQLSLYAPSRWRPPRTGQSADDQRDHLDPFVRLGYAMVENVLPDPDALRPFLLEETRLSRRALAAAGAELAAPARVSLSSRLRQIDRTVRPRPRLRTLVNRCERVSRRAPPEPLVDLETWTVPRLGMRAVDLQLTYTEWLLVAAQLGVIDPLCGIGLDAVAADPVHCRGLHPWLPGGQSRHAVYLREQASNAWMSWDADRGRSVLYLLRILEVLPELPPTMDLEWAGMPDRELTRDFPVMQSWHGSELADARAMVQELLDDDGSLPADAVADRLQELDLVLPGLDEYWLQTEPKTGLLDELRDRVGEFGEGFAEGFLVPFEGDPLALASRLWDIHKVHAPYLPLLSNVIIVGVVYGAGEYVVDMVSQVFAWLDPDAVQQAIEAIVEMLESTDHELGALFGQAAALMAKETADRLIAAGSVGWYAFELGRLFGPLVMDTVLGAVFAGYVVPRLASAAALVLREAVESVDAVVDLRRAWAGFDRHVDGPDPDPDPDPDPEPDTDPDPAEPDPEPEPDLDPEPDPDPAEPPPPITPLDRLGQVTSSPARAEFLRTGLPAANRAQLLKALNNPARANDVLVGIGLLSDAIPDEALFRAVIRAYTTSGVKIGIPETLGRVTVKATPTHGPRKLIPDDLDLLPPPPVTSTAVQDKAFDAIARHCASYEELNEVSAPMGPARPGNDKDRLQDLWLARKEAMGRLILGDHGVDENLWDEGQALPVKRNPGDAPDEGRVRATRLKGGDVSRPEQVEGWLSRTTGDVMPGRTSIEVRDAAALGYRTDASHLFPKSLGGPPELWNLIAASRRFNRSWMAWTEHQLRGLHAEHGELYLRIDLTWGEGDLPKSITYRAYKRADHGGPELVYTDEIYDLHAQIQVGTDAKSGRKIVIEPRLAGDILDGWGWGPQSQIIGET